MIGCHVFCLLLKVDLCGLRAEIQIVWKISIWNHFECMRFEWCFGSYILASAWENPSWKSVSSSPEDRTNTAKNELFEFWHSILPVADHIRSSPCISLRASCVPSERLTGTWSSLRRNVCCEWLLIAFQRVWYPDSATGYRQQRCRRRRHGSEIGARCTCLLVTVACSSAGQRTENRCLRESCHRWPSWKQADPATLHRKVLHVS